MNLISHESLDAKKKELRDFFWSGDTRDYSDSSITNWYKTNSVRLDELALELRAKYPFESGWFLTRYYNSPFFYRMALNQLSIIKRKTRFSRHEKLQIITEAYEKGYYHFGFLTIVANYSDSFMDSVFSEWFVPSTAEEYIDPKKNKSYWTNEAGDSISGKKWIVQNSPLHKFCPLDSSILENIRHADSHGGLVFHEKSLMILDRQGKILNKIPEYQFNKIFHFTYSALRCAFHFNIHLFLKGHFWISPCLIWLNTEKFDYQAYSFPDVEKSNSVKGNPKKAIGGEQLITKETIKKIDWDNVRAYVDIFFDIFIKDIWQIIETEKDQISFFLEKFNLTFDFEYFRNEWEKSGYDTFCASVKTMQKLKNAILGEDEDTIILDRNSYLEFDMASYATKIAELWETNKEKRTIEQNKDLIANIFFNGMMTIIVPIGGFVQSLQKAIKESAASTEQTSGRF